MPDNNTVFKFIDALNISDKYPFPYIPEKFTKEEKKILLQFFTNVDKPIFAIHNLPQEVIGAMFSRYSRSAKSVRRLFLDEFWTASELGIKKATRVGGDDLVKARERTKNFYQRVFAEYGDDSVIQMGSVHIAFEFVSQLIGAKAVEDQRVASAYIEKSTRYLDFGSQVNGHYLFMEPPEIMESEFAQEFLDWNKALFDAYTKHLPKMIVHLSEKYPLEKQIIEDSLSGNKVKFTDIRNNEERVNIENAYKRALKAKAFDTIRSFLPITTVTNLGAHFSGHAAETTINKMLASPYSEARVMGKAALEEILKVTPNFMQNIDHQFGEIARQYRMDVREKADEIGERWGKKIEKKAGRDVSIVDWDKDADIKLASQILYIANKSQFAKRDIIRWAKKVKHSEGKRWSPTLVKIILSAVPDRKKDGRNRRQKLPRAFEHVYIEVDFFDNIGTYKDLQRNRMSSTERQAYRADDLYIPKEYQDKGMEDVLGDYLKLAGKTLTLQKKLLTSGDKKLFSAAEYITLLGNKVRFNVRANIRQWVFFSELRTIAGGHPTYRRALQEATRHIITKMPFLETLFTHTDWTEDYGLGRLKAEISTQERLSKIK